MERMIMVDFMQKRLRDCRIMYLIDISGINPARISVIRQDAEQPCYSVVIMLDEYDLDKVERCRKIAVDMVRECLASGADSKVVCL